MGRPLKIPRWANVGGVLVEPPSGKKDIGWLVSEKPPAQYENWVLNNLAAWAQYLDPLSGDGASGRLLVIRSDFSGDRLDRHVWQGPQLSNAIAQIADDSAQGGYGVLELQAATAAPWTALVQMLAMPEIAALNWRVVVRLRTPNAEAWTNAALVKAGLAPAPAGADASAYFEIVGTGGGLQNYQLVVNGVPFVSPAIVATPPQVTAHDVLEFICIGGTLVALINGAVINPATAITYTGGIPTPFISAQGSTTNDGTLIVDDFTLIVDRLSTAGLDVSAVPPHKEPVLQVMTPGLGNGHNWIDVVFATSFADTNYVLTDVAMDLPALGDPNPGYPTFRNKTTNGCRLLFDAAWSGTFRGTIKEPE